MDIENIIINIDNLIKELSDLKEKLLRVKENEVITEDLFKDIASLIGNIS